MVEPQKPETGARGGECPPDDPTIVFVLRVAEALHRYGAPAHRLEDLTKLMARRLGVEGQFFAMPTAFMAAFGSLARQRTYLVRVESSEINLGKQAALDEVVTDVLEGRIGPAEGGRRVEAVVAAPPRWPQALTVFCSGVSSAASARFFGGGWREMVVAGVAGLVVGALSGVLGRANQGVHVFEVVAALACSVLAALGAWLIGPMSTTIAVLGGLVFLLPGFPVTVAMNELASRHLISGTGRLMGALTVLLVMGLGVALGEKLTSLIPGADHAYLPIGLPRWTEWIALCAGLAAYIVTLRVPPKSAWVVFAAGALTYVAAQAGTRLLGPDIGTGLAALVLGLSGNLYVRIWQRPSSIPIVPAIMLLVPGSFGLRGLFSLMDRNVVTGVEGMFHMGMIAATIVTGLLLANVILPPRRVL